MESVASPFKTVSTARVGKTVTEPRAITFIAMLCNGSTIKAPAHIKRPTPPNKYPMRVKSNLLNNIIPPLITPNPVRKVKILLPSSEVTCKGNE